jgi:hypothetical protein
VAAPADAAVAAVCAAEVFDPCAVVADRLGGWEVDLRFRRAELGVDERAVRMRPTKSSAKRR